MSARSRSRIHGFKRVLQAYRDQDISDGYLAGVVHALNGAPIGAIELDRIIAEDLAAGLNESNARGTGYPAGA